MSKILVADDDDLVCEFLSAQLAARGHTVVVAEDGLAALDACAITSFDVLILDDTMPGLSGWEVLAALQLAATPPPPAIMLSRQSADAIGVLLNAFRVAHFVQKPLCIDELLAHVGTACSQARPAATDGALRRLTPLVAALVLGAAPWPAKAQFSGPVSQSIALRPLPDVVGPQARWSVGIAHDHSRLSQASQPNWHDTQIGVEFSPQPSALYSVELARFNRFGLTDHMLSVRGDWRIGRAASVYLGAAVSPEHRLREKWGVRVGGGLGVGHGVELGLDARIADYVSGLRVAVTPQITVNLADEKVAVSGGWINLWEPNGTHFRGGSVRIRAQPAKRLRLFAGFANYPEVDSGTTFRVQSLSGGVSYNLTPQLLATTSYSRDRYAGAFVRQTVSLGLRWSWGRAP